MTIRLAAYTLILFASWNFNLLGLPAGYSWSRAEPRAGAVGTDSQLVLYRLLRTDVHPLHPLFCEGPKVYVSQFGLQGVALAAAGVTPQLAPFAAAAFALLTALGVAAVFAAAHRDLGAPVGDVACGLAAFAPVYLTFAPSLYWVPFLLLAPFAVVWWLGPWATTPARRAALVGAVGGCVYLKALCGYEYITTVILAPVAAAWFHQHRTGDPMARRFSAAVALVGVGLLAFALALGTHVLQIQRVLGTDGIAAIRDRAAARTVGPLDGDAPSLAGEMPRGQFAVRCFWGYFDQRALGGPATLGNAACDVPLRTVAIAAGVFALLALLSGSRNSVALAGALALGFAASASWQVLAVNHMCVHPHLNLIVFAVPFLPLAFVAAGYAVRFLGPQFGVTLLVSLPVLMAANGAYSAYLSKVDAAEQAVAEERVTQYDGPPGAGMVGAVDTMRAASAVPPGLLLAWGQFDPVAGGPPDPAAVIATGWAMFEPKAGPRASARVVAVCGGEVVRCRVVRFRRSDVDAVAGRPQHQTGFVLVVSGADAARGPLRLFAVPASGDGPPVELKASGK